MTSLSCLLNRSLQHYEDCKQCEEVVSTSIPILYFGDVNEYYKSKIKIVTVGKNPSFIEFCRNKNEPYSFFRFPDWEKNNDLSKALNSYFENKPYECWFKSFEPVLTGINASYYRNINSPNRVIHTDICSPIATKPTWRDLPSNIQNNLYKVGFDMWEELINILQPDIILLSFAKQWFKQLNLINERKFMTFKNKKNGKSERSKPYMIYQYDYNLRNNKIVNVFFGQAAQTPFGTLDDNSKQTFGKKINKLLKG